AGQLAPRAPASRVALGRTHLPRLRPDARRYRHGPERATRLPAGVAVRGRTLRPQIRLPLLQPAVSARPRTAGTPGPGVRAHAVAGPRTPAPDGVSPHARVEVGERWTRAGTPQPAAH